MTIRKRIVISILYLVFASGANAGLLTFSYQIDQNVLTGTVIGELQNDGDTIFVSGVVDFGIPDVERIDLQLLGSFQLFEETDTFGGQAVVTISGTFVDLLACDTYCHFMARLLRTELAEAITMPNKAARQFRRSVLVMMRKTEVTARMKTEELPALRAEIYPAREAPKECHYYNF